MSAKAVNGPAVLYQMSVQNFLWSVGEKLIDKN
jgi:hypothetical protein